MPTIQLSLKTPGQFLVKEKHNVKAGEILAECDVYSSVIVNIANDLGVKPRETIKYLTKKIGEKVEVGEALAYKKNLFDKKILRAKVAGVLKSLENDTGKLKIITRDEKSQLISPVNATVEKIEEDKTIRLEFEGEVFEGKEAGGKKIGRIKILTEEEEPVDLFDIKHFSEDILLVGFSWSKEAVKKAQALDLAIVGVKVDNASFKNRDLEIETTSFIILGRDSYLRLVKMNDKPAVLLGSERRLYVQND